MGAWVVGRNLAGYLPESHTYAFRDWNEAYEQFVLLACEYADEEDDLAYEWLQENAVPEDYPDYANSGYGDDEPSMLATVKAILRDGDDRAHGLTGTNEPAGMALEDSNGRRIAFWLDWSDDREPDEFE